MLFASHLKRDLGQSSCCLALDSGYSLDASSDVQTVCDVMGPLTLVTRPSHNRVESCRTLGIYSPTISKSILEARLQMGLVRASHCDHADRHLQTVLRTVMLDVPVKD